MEFQIRNFEDIENLKINQIMLTGFVKMLIENFKSTLSKFSEIDEHKQFSKQHLGRLADMLYSNERESFEVYDDALEEAFSKIDDSHDKFQSAFNIADASYQSIIEDYDRIIKLDINDPTDRELLTKLKDLVNSVESNSNDMIKKLSENDFDASVNLAISKLSIFIDKDITIDTGNNQDMDSLYEKSIIELENIDNILRDISNLNKVVNEVFHMITALKVNG